MQARANPSSEEALNVEIGMFAEDFSIPSTRPQQSYIRTYIHYLAASYWSRLCLPPNCRAQCRIKCELDFSLTNVAHPLSLLCITSLHHHSTENMQRVFEEEMGDHSRVMAACKQRETGALRLGIADVGDITRNVGCMADHYVIRLISPIKTTTLISG